MDGWFKAVDATNGRVLWQVRTPSGIIGQPVTYSVGSVQYIAILCGIGGWPGVVANAEVDARVRNAALGFVGATQDLPLFTAGGSTLMVFVLPRNVRAAMNAKGGQNAQAAEPAAGKPAGTPPAGGENTPAKPTQQ